jgi:hypothetical protein
MLHDFVWFFTTGRFQSDWVQAIAAVVLVVLTFVTLIYLRVYVRDTRTLARTSVAQMGIVKKEYEYQAMRRFQTAFDCVFKANDDVISILQSLVDGTFGTRPQLPIYPQNWPEVTAALIQHNSDMTEPSISLGVSLRAADLAVGAFFEASDNDEKTKREKAVREAMREVANDCQRLIDTMKIVKKQ